MPVRERHRPRPLATSILESAGNPWLPVPALPEVAPAPDAGSILAIIPTAGRDLPRLRACLASLHAAAGQETVSPVVVLSPATPETRRKVRDSVGGGAEILPLDGAFNYCRSINAGLNCRTTEGYALLLNDDCRFEAGSLAELKTTLRRERWACVGPWVEGFHRGERGAGAIRTNAPVNGACVLWGFAWLDRIGTLDERFGEGWGYDEADLCLRTRRRGARFGREDGVLVRHDHHGTFGAAARWGGELQQINARHWREKWPGVHHWGEGVHWEPLPGCQVVMSVRNAAPYLERCLASIEAALDGFRWVLCVADDGSDDGSWEILQAHRSGADQGLLRRFDERARNVNHAKNRAQRLGHQLAAYPVVVMMDADDEMTPNRVRHLLPAAVDGGHAAVYGAHENVPSSGKPHVVQPDEERQWRTDRPSFGPWATLFHLSLVPPDGRLHQEHIGHMGDTELWLRWWLEGTKIIPVPGPPVHRYYHHPGTVSRNEKAVEARERFKAQREQLLKAARREVPEPWRSAPDWPTYFAGFLHEGTEDGLIRLMQERQPRLVVEIGAYLGCSTRLLAGLLPEGGELWSIDPFHAPPRQGFPERLRARDGIYQQYLVNVRSTGLCERVCVVRGCSPTAGEYVPGSPDLVYVDGDHRPSAVAADIRYWWPRLAPGGILCGDDWELCRPETAEDVKTGVVTAAAELGLTVQYERGFWWLCSTSTPRMRRRSG